MMKSQIDERRDASTAVQHAPSHAGHIHWYKVSAIALNVGLWVAACTAAKVVL